MTAKSEIFNALVTKIRKNDQGETMHGFAATNDGRSIYLPAKVIEEGGLTTGTKHLLIVHHSTRPNSSDFVASSATKPDGGERLWEWLDNLETDVVDVDAVLDKMEEFGLVSMEEPE